jgi:glycosyltransferase involved in cell wall biosynthesis
MFGEFDELVAAAVASNPTTPTFTVTLPQMQQRRALQLACKSYGMLRVLDFVGADAESGFLCQIVPEEKPLVALSVLVRDDVPGLQNLLASAVIHVDEIVIVVDGRSVPETEKIARAWADTVIVFQASDLAMSSEAWAEDEIKFATARNLGLDATCAEWSLVVDADEYLVVVGQWDLRAALRALPEASDALTLLCGMGEFHSQNTQRLTRTRLRWVSETHNRIEGIKNVVGAPATFFIATDGSFRSEADLERRKRQREIGIEALVVAGRKGDWPALFHAAKHFMGYEQVDRAIPLIEYFRLRTEIHGMYVDERIWLALMVAGYYHGRGELRLAEQWGCRALLDGVTIEAAALLGAIAESDGDPVRALRWYECACAVESRASKFTFLADREHRFVRRDTLRALLFARGIEGATETLREAAPDAQKANI